MDPGVITRKKHDGMGAEARGTKGCVRENKRAHRRARPGGWHESD